MKPHPGHMLVAAVMAVAALTACRREVPPPSPPLPAPDKLPRPTVQLLQYASADTGGKMRPVWVPQASDHAHPSPPSLA